LNLPIATRVLLFITCALFSIIVAMVTGLLSHAPGGRIASAILRGGGAFAASLTLCLLTLTSLGVL
jgi:hypothetical protein